MTHLIPAKNRLLKRYKPKYPDYVFGEASYLRNDHHSCKVETITVVDHKNKRVTFVTTDSPFTVDIFNQAGLRSYQWTGVPMRKESNLSFIRGDTVYDYYYIHSDVFCPCNLPSNYKPLS